MALSIKNREIIGEIDNLKDKLDGKLPVDRLELLHLVNSWGRHYKIYISGVNDMQIEIEQCEAKECYNLSKLDVSQITNMDYIFKYSLFTGDINLWDVSNVSTMNHMFYYAINFNQDLNQWNTSNVINMIGMFSSSIFNQDISQWDVSNVTSMYYMFGYTDNYNQPLNNWKTSKVIDMKGMFRNSIFNQDISQWDVSNVTNMGLMFAETKVFNQNIGNWNLDNIINCDFMFNKAKTFLDKYNGGESLPRNTEDIKEWFNLNRDKMNMIDVKDKHGKEIDIFFINVYSKNKDVLNELNKMDK